MIELARRCHNGGNDHACLRHVKNCNHTGESQSHPSNISCIITKATTNSQVRYPVRTI